MLVYGDAQQGDASRITELKCEMDDATQPLDAAPGEATADAGGPHSTVSHWT